MFIFFSLFSPFAPFAWPAAPARAAEEARAVDELHFEWELEGGAPPELGADAGALRPVAMRSSESERVLQDLTCAWYEEGSERPFAGALEAKAYLLRCRATLKTQFYFSPTCRLRFDGQEPAELRLAAPEGERLPRVAEFSLRFDLSRCTVSFDSNGGSPLAAVDLDAGDLLALPRPPRKEGAVFLYWERKYGGGPWDFSSQAVTRGETLVAVYDAPKRRIDLKARYLALDLPLADVAFSLERAAEPEARPLRSSPEGRIELELLPGETLRLALTAVPEPYVPASTERAFTLRLDAYGRLIRVWEGTGRSEVLPVSEAYVDFAKEHALAVQSVADEALGKGRSGVRLRLYAQAPDEALSWLTDGEARVVTGVKDGVCYTLEEVDGAPDGFSSAPLRFRLGSTGSLIRLEAGEAMLFKKRLKAGEEIAGLSAVAHRGAAERALPMTRAEVCVREGDTGALLAGAELSCHALGEESRKLAFISSAEAAHALWLSPGRVYVLALSARSFGDYHCADSGPLQLRADRDGRLYLRGGEAEPWRELAEAPIEFICYAQH